MRYQTIALVCVSALGASSVPALAQSAGDWTIGIGAHQVNPKSGNGRLVDGTLKVNVGSDIKPTITAEYFIRDRLGIEVLASVPFKHDISIAGLGKVGSTKHLPPTVSMQYHFGNGKVQPFVGAGLNYTAFFSEKSSGALAGSKLSLDNSWGLAAHVGVDIAIGDRGALRFDARWMDIDTKVKLDGDRIGTVNIDPLVYGAAYVLRF
ncbi:MAG: OmpW family outer membrane protein [Dokdonella sp.]